VVTSTSGLRPRRPGRVARVRVQEHDDDATRRHEDTVATEEPLEVRLGWPGHAPERVAVTMRTPGHDFELAAGLLHAEGVLVPGHVDTIAYCTDETLSPEEELNVVTVHLDAPPPRTPLTRRGTVTAASSACGVCGAESVRDVLDLAVCGHDRQDGRDDLVIDPAVVRRLPGLLRADQGLFDRTGGVHAAGLFTADGATVVVREDVGRHNAVDKAVGHRLLAGVDPRTAPDPVLCVSGRLGFEVVQKAVAAHVRVVVAVGAPTSLAVRLAREAGQTLVGFTRGERFVVYAGAHRIG
jgi:FdhD protein